MPELEHFPKAKQAESNSCWACASRMINNWYKSLGKSGRNPLYDSDQKLADAWADKTRTPAHADIDKQQSAAAALADLGYTNNTDERALPTKEEIKAEITANKPLLAIIGDAAPRPNPDPDYKNGHWIVIIGISDDKTTIKVFDPDDGEVHAVAYNSATYKAGSYWQNTSYVDSQ